MVYYEKKSDKAEDMIYFGISSTKSKDSPTIEVEIEDDKGNVIKDFDIGWYDIDLGRGSKASFIRLNNQFQVWMVEADFYDLSLDKKDWTYSSLWNLRYGRFISYNDIKSNDKVMNIVKELLNTYIVDIYDDIKGKNVGTIKIKAENNNNIELSFYEDENGKIFVKYNFLSIIKGKHLEIFANSIKDKYLEIDKKGWESLKDDTIS